MTLKQGRLGEGSLRAERLAATDYASRLLGAWTFMRRDVYFKVEKYFFPKFFFKKISKKFPKNFQKIPKNFQKNFFFKKISKNFFSNFSFKKSIFQNKNFYVSNKLFLKKKKNSF